MGGGGGGGGLFQGIQFAISLSLSFVWISTFVMTGHPGLGWATQPPALDGPYGEKGFWFFKSTVHVSCGPMKTLVNVINLPWQLSMNCQTEIFRSFWPWGLTLKFMRDRPWGLTLKFMRDRPTPHGCFPELCLLSVCVGSTHVNGLVKDCSNSIANALELRQFCTKRPKCPIYELENWQLNIYKSTHRWNIQFENNCTHKLKHHLNSANHKYSGKIHLANQSVTWAH